MTATTTPILGIDLSDWNGDVDFEQVAAWSDGAIKFVVSKVSEGTTYISKKIETYWRGTLDHKMFPGGYHFDRWLDPAAPQIANFVKGMARVGGHVPGVLSPALDEEGYQTGPDHVPAGSRRLVGDKWYAWMPGENDQARAKAMSLRVREALEAMEAATGRWPTEYIGRNFFSSHMGYSVGSKRVFDEEALALTSWRLWMPDYTPPMDTMPVPWTPTIWQKTGKGTVPGIKGAVDINQFMGTMDDLRELAGLPRVSP